MRAAFQSSSLQDRLDAITWNTRQLVQADRLAVSENATADLFHSGIEERILGIGARAPEFNLQDARTGKIVRSVDLLALGPVVIKFFRGRWCPYCMTELESWKEYQAELRRLGALFVAISPQTSRQNDFTLQQHGLSFPLLSDPGAVVANDFGIAYSVPEAQQRYFQSILINIPFNNSGLSYHNATAASWRLNLPAVFVVARDSTIAFSEGHADFRVRPEPAGVIAILQPKI